MSSAESQSRNADPSSPPHGPLLIPKSPIPYFPLKTTLTLNPKRTSFVDPELAFLRVAGSGYSLSTAELEAFTFYGDQQYQFARSFAHLGKCAGALPAYVQYTRYRSRPEWKRTGIPRVRLGFLVAVAVGGIWIGSVASHVGASILTARSFAEARSRDRRLREVIEYEQEMFGVLTLGLMGFGRSALELPRAVMWIAENCEPEES